ncbi:MAG: hypothetical protein SWK76_03175 [Actinomycetota bacterium]|nr:hypothetical protein [Actinomycetota bacterium]
MMREQQQPDYGYVSPADYNALRDESCQQGAPSSYRETSYYQAAMQHPDAMRTVAAPAWMRKREATDIIILVLKNSLIMFFVLIVLNLFVGLLAAAIADRSLMSGSEAGLWIGTFLMMGTELAVIICAGYRTSEEAMERGRGWMYGAACVAAIFFIWQMLLQLILTLAFNIYFTLNIFSPMVLLVGVFLYVPMGAFGGWLAERRYMGTGG